MKNLKLLIVISILFTLSSPHNLFAQSKAPSPNPSQNQVPQDSTELENIQKIKDIVASKVAELNLVEKKGILGTIKEINGMKIVVSDVRGDTRNIDVDELTKFEFSDDEDTGISDLKAGERYSFVGLYNKDTERLLARTIDSVNTIPVYFEGAITEIFEDDYQIKVVNAKGEEATIDIQNSTKTSLAGDDGDLVKSGFSKLELNTRIIAIGFWDKDTDKLLSASRVIHFEDVPPSKEMQSHVKVEEN